MDFTTLIGLGLGGLILVVALVLGQVPIMIMFKPEALLVVFGGTFTAVLVSFSTQTLMNAFRAMVQCFYKEAYTTWTCVNYITEVASFVRGEGLLALQGLLDGIDIPFFRKGLGLLVDNRNELFVRESLGTEIEISYREAMDYARVFEVAGGYAPTMGIIGAVIGLMHVVQSFHDPVELGRGVAGAFSSTLYGVAISNLFLLPISGKLRQRARDEWFQKNLILEGLMSIRVGEHPILLEEKLTAFTAQSQVTQPSGGWTNNAHESNDLYYDRVPIEA